MRLRVRVPNEEEKDSGRHWLLRWWFGESEEAEPAVGGEAGADSTTRTDRRWATVCGVKYLQRGRLCVREAASWRFDYLFDVLSNRQLRQVRISLPEPSVAEWEKQHNRRMTEGQRWRLVMTALEKALQSKNCSCQEAVPESAVQSSEPEPPTVGV